MTDQELQQIARKIAVKNYKHFGDEKSIDLMAHEYEDVIKQLAKNHCIASKDKAIAFYNGDTFGELDFIELVSSRRILKSLFGAELFENSKTDGND